MPPTSQLAEESAYEPIEGPNMMAEESAYADEPIEGPNMMETPEPDQKCGRHSPAPHGTMILVVITGLPGLGKSYFIKLLKEALDREVEGNQRSLRDRTCIAIKDQMSTQFRRENDNQKPSQTNILDLTMKQLHDKLDGTRNKQPEFDVEEPPAVLVFNMNINPVWAEELAARIRREGFYISRVVLLSPGPPGTPFRHLQAAAAVLATEVRTGHEPEDEARLWHPIRRGKY